MQTLDDQLEWEKHLRELGLSKVQAQLEEAQAQGRLTDTPLGTGVLRRYVIKLSGRLSKEITEDLGRPGKAKAYSPLLRDLDPDSVAFIAIATALNNLARQDGDEAPLLSTVGHAIGRRIYSEIALAKFRDLAPDLFDTLNRDLAKKMSRDQRHRMTIFRMQAKKNGLELPEWTAHQKLQVGIFLLSLMEHPFDTEYDHIVEQFKGHNGKNVVYKLRISDHVFRIHSAIHAQIIAVSGFTMPCIHPPEDWTGEHNVGGFRGALKIRAPRFFKGSEAEWSIMQKYGHNPAVALRMLNIHQRVGWKVNPYIRDILHGISTAGNAAYTIPKQIDLASNHEEPVRPEWLDRHDGGVMTENQATEFKLWKARRRDWHTDIRISTRLEQRFRNVMRAAQDMSKYDRFWYVFQVCRRGRMYPVSGPLNPQGSDMQKAILHFADGYDMHDPMALFMFKLTLASKFGIDKLSPAACVKWVDDNECDIVRAAIRPLDKDAFKWWTSADSPLQFIAYCDEYRRYLEDPVGFRGRLSASMDGTCNGLQNYSAFGRDEVGGRAVNLISDESGVPNDIYGDVAKAAYKRLLAMPDSPIRNSWLQHGFNRKLTKTSVMTQVYGSTFGTCRKSIIMYCIDNELFESDRYNHADYAAKLVWAAIGDVVTKAADIMEWLRKSAGKIMAEGNNHITWLAPTGFRVVQIYDKHKLLRVQTYMGEKMTLSLEDRANPTGPNKIRHRNAWPPNFIHCIDASHMAFTTCDMEDKTFVGIPLHFIHDDFGCHPKFAAILARSVREQFVRMHENYSLEDLRKEYPFLDEPPALGNLDIRVVLDSINFFR